MMEILGTFIATKNSGLNFWRIGKQNGIVWNFQKKDKLVRDTQTVGIFYQEILFLFNLFFPKFSIFEWLEFGFSTKFSRKSMYHSILVELKASLDSLSLESLSSGTALCYMRNETRIIILTGQLCTVQSQ